MVKTPLLEHCLYQLEEAVAEVTMGPIALLAPVVQLAVQVVVGA
jgi:hypothetical protein